MKLLFLTLYDFNSVQERQVYPDLLREFIRHGHEIYAISPVEKRKHQATHIIEEERTKILKLQIGNTQKTNIIEKGINTFFLGFVFKRAIKKFFHGVKFDLILYPTPPVTFVSAVEYVKKRDKARTYLLLKDIFPQNAIDLGMLSNKGLKGILWRYFRRQEKKLYALSDRIGCMSPANVEYLLAHNPEIDPDRVEICPNCVNPIGIISCNDAERIDIRKKYSLPLNKKIFIYGGNLGKPQGIQFIIECLRACQACPKLEENGHFLIIGTGTEQHLLFNYVEQEKPSHVTLMKQLPPKEYEKLVSACDVGLIFLDHRFTIPNFPSRLLSYMAAKLPVLACTDTATDIGKTIIDGGFGWWCESNKADNFVKVVKEILETLTVADLKSFGQVAYEYLEENYSVENDYQKIMASIKTIENTAKTESVAR